MLFKNRALYHSKRLFYAYLIPFVETEEIIFLKTRIPDRKATKYYNIKIKIFINKSIKYYFTKIFISGIVIVIFEYLELTETSVEDIKSR